VCRVLEVSGSGCYPWRNAAPTRAAKKAEDARVGADPGDPHRLRPGVRGAEDHRRAARGPGADQQTHRPAAAPGRHRRPAPAHQAPHHDPGPIGRPVPDLLGRDFTASAPNLAWAGDITSLPLAGGRFCHRATVIDWHSRRLIGYSMADHLRAELVVDAVEAAVGTRGETVSGVIFPRPRFRDLGWVTPG
jgi:transposase InsO family protein